jgi:hypothetical protein
MTARTPLQLLKTFLVPLPDGTFDASRIHSRECYLQWLANRFHNQTVPDTDSEIRKFHRALCNHVSGSDGRTPFSPEEEKAILKVLRVKQKWPCVPEHLPMSFMGNRNRGYHEKLADHAMKAEQVAASALLVARMPEDPDRFVRATIIGIMFFCLIFNFFNRRL